MKYYKPEECPKCGGQGFYIWGVDMGQCIRRCYHEKPAAQEEDMKNFCVIGAQVARTWDRRWFEDEAEAVAHAEGLARKSYSNDRKPVTLFVVERKKVVELGMPESTVRDPTEKDAITAEDD